MRAGRMPGLAAAIVRDGEIAWARGYGWANLADERRATPDVQFMLASVSKTFIAVAVMQAVEDGLLDLDADVDDVLPFPVRNPAFPDAAITARMLLAHTSSIRDNWDVLTRIYTPGDSPVPLGAFLEGYLVPGGRHYDAERNFLSSAPGTAYAYGNEGAALAAYLVEAASGTPFDAWCEARIFAPLGMAETSWHLRGLDRAGVAMPYRWSHARYRAYGHYGYPDYPDGALRTSARQLARFLLAFIGDGELDGVRILQASSVEAIRRRQFADVVPGQGLIWYVLHRKGERLLGHNGGDSGVATQMYYRPADGTGVITLTNGNWRRSGAAWPLSQIMDRLFDEAERVTNPAISA
jgi:CubicO group peptidase (beta-lactamase class C family)